MIYCFVLSKTILLVNSNYSSEYPFISFACEFINEAETDFDGLVNFVNIFFVGRCIPSYKIIIDSLRQDEWINEFSLTSRLLLHQHCREFGWHPTSTSDRHPFGSRFPVDWFYAICYDVFNISEEEIIAGTNKTNIRFGGLIPNVKNMLFTQGMNDPMRSVGFHEDLNESARLILIDGV